jgi:hypothetical protein
MKRLSMNAFCKLTLLVFFASLMAGCAALGSGTHQTISVDTDPVVGAKCKLKNRGGVFYIPSTPGSVSVRKSYHKMTITCTKPGYITSVKSFNSRTGAWVAGDAVMLSPVGAAIDVGSGAAYNYPQEIHMPMVAKHRH